MRKLFVYGIIILLSNTSVFAATNYFPPLLPKNTSENKIINSAQIDLSQLNSIEKNLFGKIYSSQNIENRLSRIEKTLFTTTYPNSSHLQRLDNIISNYNKQSVMPNISKKSLTKIEKKLFGQDYAQNDAKTRIERLEAQLFGTVQNGDYQSRLRAIELASKVNKNAVIAGNTDSKPAKVLKTMFGGNSTTTGYDGLNNQSGWGNGWNSGSNSGFGWQNSFLNNGWRSPFNNTLNNPFNRGYMTGYTPSLHPSIVGRPPMRRHGLRPRPHPPIYPNGMDNTANNGYGITSGSSSFESGASVRILD